MLYASSTPTLPPENVTPVYVQGYQPVTPPEQPTTAYTPVSTAQQGYPPSSLPVPQAKINTALMQALIFGAMLITVGVVLVIGSRFISMSIFLICYSLIYGGMNYFAGWQTARKHGKISLSLLTCFLANLAYMAILLSFPSLFPYSLYGDGIRFIVQAVVLAFGVGALGGVIGRKQARKKAAHLPPQPSGAASPPPKGS